MIDDRRPTEHLDHRRSARRQALRIAGSFMLLSGLWILFSDRAVALLTASPLVTQQIQTLKGWLYVALAGWLIGYLVYRSLRRQQTIDEDRERLFTLNRAGLLLLDVGRIRRSSGSIDLHGIAAGTSAVSTRLFRAMPDIQVRAINPAALDLMGVHDLAAFLHLLDQQQDLAIASAMQRAVAAVLAGERLYECEVELPGADRYALCQVMRIPDQPDRMIVTITDISARVRAEQEARRARTLFEEALQASGPLLYRLDLRTGSFDYLSESATSVLGIDRDLLLRDGIDALLHHVPEADREAYERPLEQARTEATSDRWHGQTGFRLQQSDQPTRHLVDWSTILLDSDRQPIVRIGSCYDQTALKEAEDLLRHAQKMQAIGQLAGGIAHDFNNLLAGIVAATDLIRLRAGEDERIAGWTDQLARSADRASDLTRKLLAFSRRRQVEVGVVDLADLVKEVSGVLAHTLDPRIRLATHVPDRGVALVMGDRHQLLSAILNLGINARDAIDGSGSIRFRIARQNLRSDPLIGSCWQHDLDDCWCLAISDDGGGMDDDTVAHCFDPFFTTKNVGYGTGLGLSAVYGTLREHDGAIGIDSAPGQGTTIILALPCRTVVPETSSVRRLTDLPADGSARVLVVDDEESLRDLSAELLRTLGHDPLVAADGASALRLLDEGAMIDLLICDLRMPGMTGNEVIRAMRDRLPELPVIVASGFGEPDQLADLDGVTIDAYLPKPFRMQELGDTIRRALRQAPTAEAEVGPADLR